MNGVPLARRAAAAEEQLAALAPELVDGYRRALPRAAAEVGRRLLGALHREDVADTRQRYSSATGHRHGFDRVEFGRVQITDPTELLPPSILDSGGRELAVELGDGVVNLAIAWARREHTPTAPPDRGPAASGGADWAALGWERLAVTGHNLHPCARTRLGWRVADVLAHDIEASTTRIGFVAVRRDLHLGDDLGALLAQWYPDVLAAPAGYLLQPVHAWQLGQVAARHADLFADGGLRHCPASLPAAPTAALRTLLLPPGADGRSRYLKLSLDIQVTSTRRTISVASTRNGPAISAVLHRLLADEPAAHRVLLLAEPAGAAVPLGVGRDRDLGAIVRCGLDGRLDPDEFAIPGAALAATDPGTGQPVLAGLVDTYASTLGLTDRAGAALSFVDDYARLLLPPVLRLATRFGIGLEAHLQNCLPTFRAGQPYRIVFRDFAGLRLHLPRLAGAGTGLALWPASVIGTTELDPVLAKVGYTALQAHLGEVVLRLVGSHQLDESAAWRRIRVVVDDIYEALCAGAAKDPHDGATLAARAETDRAFLTAPTVPHKALVRMRLAGTGDLYQPVRNPLHGY